MKIKGCLYLFIVLISKSNIIISQENSNNIEKGKALQIEGKFSEAINFYNNYLLTVSNSNYEIYFERAMCFKALKQYNNAINDLNKSIALAPKNTNNIRERSKIYFELDDYVNAIDDLTLCIKIHPILKIYYHDRARIYLINKQFQEAIDDFSVFIKSYEYDFVPYYYRGLAYFELKQYEFAILDYNQSITLGDKNFNYKYDYKTIAIEKLKK